MSNTVFVGQPVTVEDHGVSTVIVPWGRDLRPAEI
jgi:hypothetical protein